MASCVPDGQWASFPAGTWSPACKPGGGRGLQRPTEHTETAVAAHNRPAQHLNTSPILTIKPLRGKNKMLWIQTLKVLLI
ncbi:unnamed protein product [Arctogadus glacialis]